MGKPYESRRKSENQRVNPPTYRRYGGRRKTDYDARTTVSKKLLVITVFLVDLLYLVGDAFLTGNSICH